MNVVGIIAEYNPFHNGHLYQMREAIARTGADYCIVAMSGNFVQRGESACADKYTRAKWAIDCGADMVIELPSVFALSPAPDFASGGVRLLQATGAVTHLSFGCETEDIAALSRLVDILTDEPDVLKKEISTGLAFGKSYPRALYEGIKTVYGDELAEIIRTPNNILGIEYLKALRRYAPNIIPVPVLRRGSAYDDAKLDNGFSSAMAIRNALKEGNPDALISLPQGVSDYFSKHPVLPDSSALSAMIYSAMRKIEKDDLLALPEVSEGLENVLYDAVRSITKPVDIPAEIKSKRYTMSRLKRTCLYALLGIKQGMNAAPGYIAVLCMKRSASPLLSQIGKHASLPLLIRSRDRDLVPEEVIESLAIDELSTDLFGYIAKQEVHRDCLGTIIV